VAIAPVLGGNNTFSPNTDISLTSSLGVAWRVGIDGVIPVWTFGKISNLWDAAGANVRLNEATLEKERDAVRADVRRAFFGLQLARDAQLLLKDVRSALDKGRSAMQAQIDKDEGDPIDLLKLETYASEIDVREAEAERWVKVALAGLRFYTGVADLDIPASPLRPPKHQLGHITRYLGAASLHRPEIAMVRAGLAARTAQVQMARAGHLPRHRRGRAGRPRRGASHRRADQPLRGRPRQLLPLRRRARLPVEARRAPDARAHSLRRSPARRGARAAALRARRRWGRGGAGLRRGGGLDQAGGHLRKAVATAKKWLITVQSGIDMGTIADKELLEPAKAYAQNRFNQLNAVMELDLAMARLAKATGWDSIAPDGT
jgi:outer membrane protein TolC